MKRLHAAVVEKQTTASTLSSYVPSQVAQKLAGGEFASEELEVSVLFSDIRGFSHDRGTAVGARHRRDRRPAPRRMAEVVAEHGGTIDKFQGDAVMVIFGAPDPQPDHAERALRCAIAMQARQSRAERARAGGPTSSTGCTSASA